VPALISRATGEGTHIQALPIAHPGDVKPATATATPLAYAVAVFGWLLSAGVYIAAKWAGPEMPPWTLCFARLALAFLILLPVVRPHHGKMLALLKTRAFEVLTIGAIGLALCQGAIYTGLNYTDATTAGIVMALSPVLTVILARFVLGEPLGLWKALGALIALIGMLVIVAHGDLSALLRLEFSLGELWIVAGAFCWGLYTVLLRRAKFGIELLPTVVLLLGAGALAALPLSLWEFATGKHTALEANGFLALAYMAAPGGALMYYIYNRSVEALGAGRASMLLYLQTVFVAMLAYLFLGESLHGYDLTGGAFIVAGLVLAALRPKPGAQK
jgi:drug/metabolite transporter (DMT)-like permease